MYYILVADEQVSKISLICVVNTSLGNDTR